MVDIESVKEWMIVNICPPILLVCVFSLLVICAMLGIWVVASACVFVNGIFVGAYFGAVVGLIVAYCSFSFARYTFLQLRDGIYKVENFHSEMKKEYFLLGIAIVCMILEGKV